MRKRGWLFGLVAVLVPGLGGCIEMTLIRALTNDDDDDEHYDDGYYDDGAYDGAYGDEPYYEEYAQEPLAVSNARLEGDMGNVVGFRDDAALYNAYGSEQWATVEVHASDERTYAAMAILDIQGGIGNPRLMPGESFVFDAQTGYDYAFDGQPLWVSMIACSGPTEGAWDYDVPADEVEITVAEGSAPSSIRIGFSATLIDYYGNTQTASGSFEALRAE